MPFEPLTIISDAVTTKAEPLCPVFGTCGGCAYQHITYEEELRIKRENLALLLRGLPDFREESLDEIVPSPKPYHYRSRIDLSLRKSKGQVRVGFQAPGSFHLIEVAECAIADSAVSNFIPQLRAEAEAKLPADYKTANLVVKTGDDGRVLWGGIGRRSLEMVPRDYLWTEVCGKRIYYSLETFFQANLSILPAIVNHLAEHGKLTKRTFFLDLYAGVGLFGIALAEKAGAVTMIEEHPASVKIMGYNLARHCFPHVDSVGGRVEDKLAAALETNPAMRRVALVDPPRKGLSPEALTSLAAATSLEMLFYLSCHPESLVRDLKVFSERGWTIERVTPFDFFPRTVHLETLVQLVPPGSGQ